MRFRQCPNQCKRQARLAELNKTMVPAGKSSVLKLCGNDIHLWITQPQYIHQVDLLTRYKGLLTEEESQKQQSYMFEKHCHNALITRAFVRDLLSHYANVPPYFWRFKKGPHGKPEIVNSQLPLRFNISHTDDLIICAVTLNDDIGCDVEMTNRNCEFLSIAENFFSSSEFAELLGKTGTQQRSRFFDYWTLKESYIKAWSQGLTIPLADFNFHIGPSKLHQYNDNISLSFAPHRCDLAELWRNWLFYPNNEHRIAVSVKAQSDNQIKPYKFRYFENTPLVKTTELHWLGISV